MVDAHCGFGAEESIAGAPARSCEGVGVGTPDLIEERAFRRRVEVAHDEHGTLALGNLTCYKLGLRPAKVAVLLDLDRSVWLLVEDVINPVPGSGEVKSEDIHDAERRLQFVARHGRAVAHGFMAEVDRLPNGMAT